MWPTSSFQPTWSSLNFTISDWTDTQIQAGHKLNPLTLKGRSDIQMKSRTRTGTLSPSQQDWLKTSDVTPRPKLHLEDVTTEYLYQQVPHDTRVTSRILVATESSIHQESFRVISDNPPVPNPALGQASANEKYLQNKKLLEASEVKAQFCLTKSGWDTFAEPSGSWDEPRPLC